MSQKEFGCFFCAGKSSLFDGICSDCGRLINISESLLAIDIGGYNSTSILGRGFHGWTLKVEDGYQPFAMKIIPTHRLKTKTVADEEARALALCAQHRNIARFFRPVTSVITAAGTPVEIFGLVFEFVADARPLSQFISNPPSQLDRGDIAGILIGITSGLARMHSSGLWHHDFHDDNILIRTVNPDENLNERYEAKLIDFGSVRPFEISRPEPSWSDYFYLSKHIFGLVTAFETSKKSQLTPPDRAFTGKLRRLAHVLADKDISRRNISPADVVEQLRTALEESTTGYNFPSFEEMKQQARISFDEPLANTNALSLAPQDVALLFRDSLGWQNRIEKSEPVFVVGPRGCGKTMFLRFLSIASRARPLQGENTPSNVAARLFQDTHIGFLVNVGQLRTPFLRSGYKRLEAVNRAKAEDFCREYLNCQFVFEVVRTILWLRTEKLIDFTSDDESAVATAVSQLIHGKASGIIPPLETLAEALDRRVMELSGLNETDNYGSTDLARDDVLVRLARCIQNINCYRQKEVWFLIDDYSVTVLPALAQQAYNPVIFQLSDQLKIKISSEGEGPVLSDTLGRKYREGRELTKLNLGEVYFACKEDEGRRFFEQILEARFQATGRGNLETLQNLLGEHEHEGNFGNYIRGLSRPGDARFYGFGLLCRLCSGDVSFIIELLHALTRGKWEAEVPRLSAHEQDVIVKRFAQRQLAELRSVAEYGNTLHEFASHLGELIKMFLLKSVGKEADERLRIEIEGSGELSDQAKLVEDALFRHSVLISGGAGKSKRGLPTRKLYFRRLFAPCFPFSPTRKGCIDVLFSDYESWLVDPSRMNQGQRPPKRQARKPDRPALKKNRTKIQQQFDM